MPDTPIGAVGRFLKAASVPLAWRIGVVARWLIGEAAARLVQSVARIPALRRTPRRLMIPVERALIRTRGAGLFDPDFYCLQNDDVAATGGAPFTHYLRHGWREGRAPNARFDDGHYRVQSGLGSDIAVSALAHFVAFGQTGGLCPVPGIDLGRLVHANPGLAVARIDPYRRLVSGGLPDTVAERPKLDDVLLGLESLDTGGRRPGASVSADVDVVVPVFRGRAETLNTLWHVLKAKTDLKPRLVVVNDASPEPRLTEDLRDLAGRGLIHLIEHRTNQGFVAAVNRGSAAHTSRDVVWLNADTEVYDGWLDRLRAAAYGRANVATVTPLTNNGTICSYPRTNTDNPGALEIDWPDLDRLTARVNRALRIEAPTAVGFATYVRRAALAQIGPLDLDAFGLGYGEENDFSQRALAGGWLNLIAADVFVRHFGATSFRGVRAQRIEQALKVLDARYPNYRQSVQDFLTRDPGADARRALDLARLRWLSAPRSTLIITHSLGGGTEQHVQEEIARLSRAGQSVFLLSGGAAGPDTASLSHAASADFPAFEALDLDGDALWSLIAELGIRQAHIHHLIDFVPEAPDILARRLAASRLSYDFVVHDYYPICPRVNLTDAAGYYCGEPDAAGCQRCLQRRGSRAGRPDIDAWRDRYRTLLGKARAIRVPDEDVARRLRRYCPTLNQIVIKPHEAPIAPMPLSRGPRRPGRLRIASLGAIGATKGFDVLLDLAGLIQRTGDPASLTVIGYTQNDPAAEAAGIAITGAYVNDEIYALIDRIDPDLIFLPSTWPETYSYTLSIALRTGRPVAAFDIGAMTTRLTNVPRGTLIPLALARRPADLYGALLDAAGQQIGRESEAAG